MDAGKVDETKTAVDSAPPSRMTTNAAAGPPASPHAARVEDAPDLDEDIPDPDEDFPDDDDLDDLDDELDQFVAPPKEVGPPPKVPAEASKGALESDEFMSEEDFAKDLSDEMRKLMTELDNSPDMQAQLEQMFASIQQVADAEVEGASTSRPGTSHSTIGPKASFKDTIAGLQDQLKNSDKATTDNLASSAGASEEEVVLSQLLKNLPMGALGGEGGGSEDDFANMLLGMMEQLTEKEILYEPMKELQTSFPGWMEKNKDKVPEEEMKKHREQQRIVNEIVGKFEESDYSDEDAERRKFIVERMQEMQVTGSVPAELLGESASMQEAFSADGGCNPQ